MITGKRYRDNCEENKLSSSKDSSNNTGIYPDSKSVKGDATLKPKLDNFLYTTKLAANTFLSEHDPKKRCDLIKESNATWREKSVEMEWMRNKRQCR
ncbi:hypothetical protein E3N88_14387 [Mikania micrantha]|uniref:Uncharacterized protein n=1 Tax=Mikania micrantha TaxID=192012 RepID=A0A5N6P2L6_9ASTR|nr:hypothetical protein E3N88_14387 [Mikania micrantha]